MATVRIPTQLRQLTNGQGTVVVDGVTVDAVLKGLEAAHPGIGERLFDDAGGLRRFVNVFVDDEDVRFQEGLNTEVGANTTVSIVPAVAGGA